MKNTTKNPLFTLKEKMINSKIGLKTKDYILTGPLCDVFYKTMHFFNLSDASHANKTFSHLLEDNNKYFIKNADRVQNIIDNLQDEKSKLIYKQMIKYRCTFLKKDHPEFSIYDQYFPRDIIKLSDKEVFIDCGAYTGDSINKFLKFSKDKYKKIVAFEPDLDNVKKLRGNKFKNCEVIQAAVWDKEGEAEFYHYSTDALSAKLSNTQSLAGETRKEFSKYKVNLKVIDNISVCKDASFIKMDIEGAELPALKGAVNIIKTNKPKLAICIYHSNEDMLQIIEWVLSLNLGYKIYVRSHFGGYEDTVMYAI
ncbi:MAG: FkbM family methyltransferase [Elusimicrobiaceae bacterium]|nr:FkbM family methyltransferase [Elusimicrobiaceae bacterium]